jgi:cell division protein FtsW
MNRIDYHWWQRFSILIMAGAVMLLGGVLFFAHDKFGAQRWLLNGSIQPSEFCKLAVIIYIAAWLASKGERIRKVTYGLVPFAVLIGFIAGLIMMQPDFSTSVLIVAIAIAMFFIAGADLLQLFIGFAFGAGTLVFLITRAPYRLTRIMDFLASLNDPTTTGYHVKRSLIALGTGGIFGKGLGASRQKFGYLPASHTDSIFAVLGEEVGLVGCLVVIGLFALLAWRGFKIALEAPDTFGAVLATGVTCWLIFQAMLNVAVATSTVPFTGIPLPFISFGGSSLVTCLAGVGLLENIAKEAKLDARRRSARYGLRREDGWTHLSHSGRRQ